MNSWRGKRIHFIGIKGIGMLGLAELLQSLGAVISGSDTAEEFPSDVILRNAGIEIKLFSEKNITKNISLVIYSSAYPESHSERKQARALNILELSYAEALRGYTANLKNIVVTGTHGKTTTTALLAHIMNTAGLKPKALVGGVVRNWRNTILSGSSDFFVIEGDEYQEKFAKFKPFGLVITSLDYDHSDYYPTAEAYLMAFKNYISKYSAKPVIGEGDAKKLGLSSYSSPESEDEKIFSSSNFPLPGEAYQKDAFLAICYTRSLNIPSEHIVKALSSFEGVERRLDFYSPPDSELLIINDYAHHPEEIKATLQALKNRYPGRKIIAVFQPHTYTRTASFLNEFAAAFKDADEIYFDEIYGSAREEKGSVTIEDLFEKTKALHANVHLLRETWPGAFTENIRTQKNALVITMGAGDIWQKARVLSHALFGNEVEPD